MYFVNVRAHVMIAHSLPDPFFGPAAGKHGATYVVDAEIRAEALDPHNVVVDIGWAEGLLKETCGRIHFQDLDEMPEFEGIITTTEFLARWIHDQMSAAMVNDFTGSLRITLHESHVAAAGYEASIG